MSSRAFLTASRAGIASRNERIRLEVEVLPFQLCRNPLQLGRDLVEGLSDLPPTSVYPREVCLEDVIAGAVPDARIRNCLAFVTE